RGDKAQNLEQAIAAYSAALQVNTREAFPIEWATTQNNLGIDYSNRIRGDKTQNLEQATAAYSAALQILTREAFPIDWAMAQNNLGIAYRNRIGGDKAQNLEQAIAAYSAALQVYTREAFPIEWATTQNNLGIAYSDRIRGDKTQNLEQATAAYSAALQVYTREAFPIQWAMTQNNLGVAYRDVQRLPEAVQAFQSALEIYTPTTDPIECRRTGRNLGNTALSAGLWQEAMQGYGAAIAAVEQSREWVTSEGRKREILEAALDVYEKMVQACINANHLERAIETVERSKSRTLVELLENRDLYPKGNIPPAIRQQLDRLRRQISVQQQLLEEINSSPLANGGQEGDLESPLTNERQAGVQRAGDSPSFSRQYIDTQRQALQASQRELGELLNQIKHLDPEFTLTQRVEPIHLAEIRTLLDADAAILEWHIGSKGFQTFIITHDSIEVEQFDTEDLEKLEAWKDEYLDTYRDSRQNTLAERLATLSQILRLDTIINRPCLDHCQQLILIPHRYLHLFPLHALEVRRKNREQTTETSTILLDGFSNGVRYAPSCQLLQRVQTRQRPASDTRPLFAIQNPTLDLAYTDIEVETIKRTFNPSHILPGKTATKAAFNQPDNLEILRRASYAHFSCHGSFNSHSPLLSSLILAESLELPTFNQSPHPQPLSQQGRGEQDQQEDTKYLTLRNGRKANPEKCLTLQEIFASLELPQCRLVTLSACETGLIDSTNLLDEYIGLPSGFLYAGSLSVVCSLWCVDDFATAFLMIKFYEILLELLSQQDKHRLPTNASLVAVALNQAQCWLKNTTQPEFLKWTRSLRLSENKIEDIRLGLGLYDEQEPFREPQYWAAFCAIGQ
ncbi:MAG: CHAT domain-containing protein, partial [Aphanothece sp. CMT-3BRIN-NPC111]|nr:CHAT domain-containing protein [Aphanothece sp. CMT-3BRIN-NPC111]